VPIRRVVVEHAEVGATNGLQIVGEAGVGHGEVILRQAGRPGVLVDERGVRIVQDLAVTMVLHHDHEHVVEVWNPSRNFALLGEHRSYEHGKQAYR